MGIVCAIFDIVCESLNSFSYILCYKGGFICGTWHSLGGRMPFGLFSVFLFVSLLCCLF